MTALVVIVAAVIGVTRCGTTHSFYLWGAYASEGTNVYLIKYSALKRARLLPGLERSHTVTLSEHSEVAVLDLRHPNAVRPLGVSVRHPMQTNATAYDYVSVGESGHVEIWGRRETARGLRAAADIFCGGYVEYDQQDSRVLYYVCEGEGAVYRFEPPYDRAVYLMLGGNAGMQSGGAGYRFYSVLGESKLYARPYRGPMYQIDLNGRERVVEVSDHVPDAVSRGTLFDREALIAITSHLRFYQVSEAGAKPKIVVERDGQFDREYALPEALVAHERDGRYLAKSNVILWDLQEPAEERIRLHILDLRTGELRYGEIQEP